MTISNVPTLMQQAAQAQKQNNWLQATKLYQQAYDLSQSLLINQQLVQALMHIKQYDQAAQLINDYLNDYLTQRDLTELYLQVLLHQHRFITSWCVYYQSKTLTLQQCQQIKTSEADYQQHHAAAIAKLQRELMHLGDKPLFAQMQGLQQAEYLPYDSFITMARFVLQDPYLSPLLRGYLLDQLRQLNYHHEIAYLYFGESKTTVPADFPKMNASKQQLKITQILEQKLSIDQPQLLATFKAQMQLDAATLYPCADQVITNPQLWAQGYCDWLHGRKINFDKELKWLKKSLQIGDDLLY